MGKLKSLARRRSRLGCQCGYAETHYKFKLPWSPLWKPWPEIFVDAPSFAIPGAKVPLWLVIKDAHEFPIQVESIDWTIYHLESQSRDSGELNTPFQAEEFLKFHPLQIEVPQPAGTYRLDFKIVVSNSQGKRREIVNTNYSGIPQRSITIERLNCHLPYPAGWVAGDLHCHTDISSDQVEFGGDLQAMTEAAACVGLDFWSPTDHSYDFQYSSSHYLEEVSSIEQWEDLSTRIQELPGHLPTVIRGEEVSAANHKDQNIHFLVIGEDQFFPGLGDGGRRWFNNKPELSIPEIIGKIQTGVCFAAHPRVRLNPVEALLLNRGRWGQEDIHPGLDGLQFWNGNRGLSYREGRAFWVQQLLRGHQLLPIAGNDAHGDLNRSVGVKWPLFSLWSSQNHLFGQVRTLFRGNVRPHSELLKALHSKECCITDGPFLSIEGLSSDDIIIQYTSNLDWGLPSQLNIFEGKFGDAKENVRQILELEMDATVRIQSSADYVRVELHTDQEHFAMTSALFLTAPLILK